MDDTYTLVQLDGDTHVELELSRDNDITLYVAGTGEDEAATLQLTEEQVLELIAELSVKVAQARMVKAALAAAVVEGALAAA